MSILSLTVSYLINAASQIIAAPPNAAFFRNLTIISNNLIVYLEIITKVPNTVIDELNEVQKNLTQSFQRWWFKECRCRT